MHEGGGRETAGGQCVQPGPALAPVQAPAQTLRSLPPSWRAAGKDQVQRPKPVQLPVLSFAGEIVYAVTPAEV